MQLLDEKGGEGKGNGKDDGLACWCSRDVLYLVG